MSSNIARLGVALAINTVEFVKGLAIADEKSQAFKRNLKETKKTVEELKTVFAIAGSAMVGFGAHALSVADEMSDLADANDTTIGSIIELQHALEASGGSANDANKFLSSFTSAIDNAAQGSDKLRDSFKAAGVSVHDLATLSGDELRSKTVAGLAGIQDAVTRNAIAMQLFGKSAKGVDFKALAQNAEDLKGRYKEQQKAVENAGAAFQKIKLFIMDMEVAAMQAMQPISNLINKLPDENRIEVMAKWFTYLGEVMLFAFGVSAVKGVMKLANAMRMLAISNPWLLGLAAAGAAAGYAAQEMGMFGGNEEGSEATSPTAPTSGSSGNAGRTIEQSARDKMIAKYNEEIKLVRQLADAEQSRQYTNGHYLLMEIDLENEKSKLTENAYNQQKFLLDIEKEKFAIQDKYKNQKSDALKQLELAPSEEIVKAKQLYDVKMETISNLEDYELSSLDIINARRQRNIDDEIKRQGDWVAGWEEAMMRYQEASAKSYDIGKAGFEAVVGDMNAALKNFVETGKLNFKDLVGSMIKDMMYMQLKAQASKLFGSLFDSVAGFFGPSVIGTGLATGGAIDGPRLVGENGPELFVPRTAGAIVPNGAWQGQMSSSGGTTINGPYIASMNAIDTQSGIQFLAKNKDTIWASYQSANRGIPVTR